MLGLKFSKSSSTLTLSLALTLTLTWVLSLRPVRLKIGDYYLEQGNFDQAANWYEKVVKKERLIGSKVGAAPLGYKEDLNKLKSAIRQQGDYYFSRANFDQAANWYERLVREEMLRVVEDRADRLKYEEDLSKLKSALRRQGDYYFNQGEFDQAANWYGKEIA